MIADLNNLILRQITPLIKSSIVKIFFPLMFCFLAITCIVARKIIAECWKSKIMILEEKKLLSAHWVLSQKDGFKKHEKGIRSEERRRVNSKSVFDFSGGMTFRSITTTDKKKVSSWSCFEAVVLVRKIIIQKFLIHVLTSTSYRCSINTDMSIDEMFFPEHLELKINIECALHRS